MELEEKNVQYFMDYLQARESLVKANPALATCLGAEFRITNVVSTMNLNVKDINLRKLAQDNFFCNYNRGTFAAMPMRLHGSTALLYPVGVMVCMATKSETKAMLASQKYVEVLNEQLGIRCAPTGFEVYNYVCSTRSFALNLAACNNIEWSAVITYNPKKFPGARVRCCFIEGLPFKTKVVMAFFLSGKVNITGARSVYEAKALFMIVYFKYLVHLRVRRNYLHARTRRLDIKEEPFFATDLVLPKITRHEPEVERYHKRLKTEADAEAVEAQPPADPGTIRELDKLIMSLGSVTQF